MGIDVLILNTAVVDIRSSEFDFVKAKVKQGGFVKCQFTELPIYCNEDYLRWIKMFKAHAGGPGNCAPLIAKAGLKVSVGVNLGAGQYGGFDVLGRLFFDRMIQNNVDTSAIYAHPMLPTAVTFIYEDNCAIERGAIAYFPNANNDFDFARFKPIVKKLKPKIVYYMYVGLSERADAHEGRDLGEFLKWCQADGAITIVDSTTFAEDPRQAIESAQIVPEYKLLDNILEFTDIFFTSSDEAGIIKNSLLDASVDPDECTILRLLSKKYCHQHRPKLWGITVRDGAFALYSGPDESIYGPVKVRSRYLNGQIVDLVGAGDAFRAGILAYICHNLETFKNGCFDYTLAISMGNLFASKYIQSPLFDRYCNIHPYDRMLAELRT